MVEIEYVYASLLLHHAGREITEDTLKKVLEAAGVKVDEVRLKAMIAALKEINIDEVISAAATVAPVAAPSAAPTAAAPSAEAKEEKKKEEKEEKKEEASEEEIAEGLAALFG